MKALRLWWTLFWARRGRGRVIAAGLCLGLAALLALGLGLSAMAPAALSALGMTLGVALAAGASIANALSPVEQAGALIALLLLIAAAIILPGEPKRAPFTHRLTAQVAPVTVYLDAENQLRRSSDQRMGALMRELRARLHGRRADLLYFLDTASSAPDRRALLYQYGFRLVEVPHNPFGRTPIREAVDKEIAMHAMERALIGPPNQEFIIIAGGDAGYTQIIYRLVGLGHSVQMWGAPPDEVYADLKQYLDAFDTLDISPLLRSTREESLDQLHAAIRGTLHVLAEAKATNVDEGEQYARFHTLLGQKLSPPLNRLGYDVGEVRLKYWTDHLTAVGALKKAPEERLPAAGGTSPLDAAEQLYAMARLTAAAIQALAQERPGQGISVDEVATRLVDGQLKPDPKQVQAAEPLLALLRRQPARGWGQRRRWVVPTTHMRYIARCARALGLATFADDPASFDRLILPGRPG